LADELVHASQGTTLTQAEFEAVGLHVLNSQATGDLIYASSATQLSRLAIGSTNAVLQTVGGVPTWVVAPTINGNLTQLVASNAVLSSSATTGTVEIRMGALANGVGLKWFRYLLNGTGDIEMQLNTDDASSYVNKFNINNAATLTTIISGGIAMYTTSTLALKYYTAVTEYDEVGAVERARIESNIEGSNGGNLIGYVKVNSGSLTERFRIDNNGIFMIGTTTATGGNAGDLKLGRKLTFTTSLDSTSVADEVSLGAYEISPTHRALAIHSEEVVVVETDETKFSHKIPVRWNGATYNIMLCDT